MEKNGIDLPVLFLIFNRAESTLRVFEEIRKAKPNELFIAADGPRNQNEKIKTDEARAIVSKIDWDCRVKTLFRDENLGCKRAVSEAISWFFDNVKYGMILEDDCLPSQSFFSYCKNLLVKYENDERVFMISGQKSVWYPFIKKSFVFSKRAYIWGWASWARSWKKYDLNNLNDTNIVEKLPSTSFFEKVLLRKRASDIRNGKLNTWDLQLEFTQRLDRGLCVVPKSNLVENIGFEISTHSFNKIDILFQKFKRKELSLPLKYPKRVIKNNLFDFAFLKFNILRIILKRLLPGKVKG